MGRSRPRPSASISHPGLVGGSAREGAHHGIVVPIYTIPQGTGQRAMRSMLRPLSMSLRMALRTASRRCSHVPRFTEVGPRPERSFLRG